MKTLGKRILIPLLAITLLLIGSGFKNDFFEIAKQIEIFTTLFKELNMNYVDETNPGELMDTAIKNMLGELDPYTVFMNEQDVEEFKMKNAGEYSGIGAIVRSYNDKLLIVEPYKGYPADIAGLKAGDEIIKIGDIDVSDFKDDASELLKGSKNSSIDIIYKRQGKSYNANIIRDEIEVDAVPYYHMVNENTGYIVLSKFNKKASAQTKEALIALKDEGAQQIILDLRGNPGGLLSEAINVTNLFVPKDELIVTTKSKVKKFNREYKTKNKAVDAEIPLVVLVNGRSASASEIVSGALQDLDRAVVVGARSFGKGLVQRPLRLTYGTQLKVTISRYYTPSGRCIQSLDYWNRDEEGNASKNSEFNEFTTRNGRKVFDGGGVMPDIEVPVLKSNPTVKSLLNNSVVFDYATNYYYNHTLNSINDFKFDDSDFSDFKEFIERSNYNFETNLEKDLKKAYVSDELKQFDSTVKSQYESLLSAITKNKISLLDTQSSVLIKELEDEIIKRYFYREGLYDYYLNHDDAITIATELLSDNSKYVSVLK